MDTHPPGRARRLRERTAPVSRGCADSRRLTGAFLRRGATRRNKPESGWIYWTRGSGLRPGASNPDWHFTVAMQSADKLSRQIRQPKTGSLFELARSSIVACCSLCGACGAATAEERQAPPNYEDLIHNAVKTSFTDPSSVGLVEMSPLHPTRGPQMGDWMACLRIAISGQPTLYAVFIDSQPPKVILLRLAVQFDNCAQDQYEPLPPAPPAQDRPAGPLRKK